jgi:hypothetical protein
MGKAVNKSVLYCPRFYILSSSGAYAIHLGESTNWDKDYWVFTGYNKALFTDRLPPSIP